MLKDLASSWYISRGHLRCSYLGRLCEYFAPMPVATALFMKAQDCSVGEIQGRLSSPWKACQVNCLAASSLEIVVYHDGKEYCKDICKVWHVAGCTTSCTHHTSLEQTNSGTQLTRTYALCPFMDTNQCLTNRHTGAGHACNSRARREGDRASLSHL